MKRLLLYLFFVLALSLGCRAEQFSLPERNLAFEVPDGGMVTYNSSTVLEIQWYDLAVLVKLYDKAKASDEYMKYTIGRTAASYNMFGTEMKKAKIKDCKGYSLTGTLPDGSRARIVNVKAKKEELAMQIEINYIADNEEIVNDILKSFKVEKKPKIKQKIQKKGAKEKPIKPGTLEGEELHHI